MNSKRNRDLKRIVISSTRKDGRVVAQQVVYKEKNLLTDIFRAGYSVTKHEKILEDDKGNLKILSRKGVKE
tara:strand:+ start:382 stop:594 length:213 start_codon:yes stop_codon:yes gene_type:complete